MLTARKLRYRSTSWRVGEKEVAMNPLFWQTGAGNSNKNIFGRICHFFVSQSECVGRFWLRESPQVVIQGNFHSLVGAKAVGSSGNHSNFVVESFDGAAGDL